MRLLKSVVSFSYITLTIIMKSRCAVDEGQMTKVVQTKCTLSSCNSLYIFDLT